MVDQILAALEAGETEKAKWLVQAILHMNGVSRVQLSKGSMNINGPLSAADLPTLLDTLLETQISPEPSTDTTWRSRLKSAATSLRESSASDSESGPEPEPTAASATPQVRPLPSNRKYWPAEAKDVFWSLVRQLNKYDKENSDQGQRSPLQLSIAEEATRRWWNVEHHDQLQPSGRTVEAVRKAAAGLGRVEWIVPDSGF